MFAIRARRKAISEKDLLEAIEKVKIKYIIYRSLKDTASSPPLRSTWFTIDSNAQTQCYNINKFRLVTFFKCLIKIIWKFYETESVILLC